MSKVTLRSSTFQVVILHLDMDAFFASVEQVDHPQLCGLPVIVGQSLRGVVTAASYEARHFGVHSAMPIAQAKKICPQGVFVPRRMARYRQVSQQVMTIIHNHCPVVEQASIDEAYADLTGTTRTLGSPTILATKLKKALYQETGLTCSIGIAPNKFLAKIASGWQKPNGLTSITPQDVPQFLAQLPLSKIPGIGRAFLQELSILGVRSMPDILQKPKTYWMQNFGKRGALLHDRAQGIDLSPVEPEKEPLSCSAEHTLEQDTFDGQVLQQWLLVQAERVGHELRTLNKQGQTITIKIKFKDFTTITRSKTLVLATNLTHEIYEQAQNLLKNQKLSQAVRLIGLSVSNFKNQELPLPLMHNKNRKQQKCLEQALDQIREKFGPASITRADIKQMTPMKK